METRDNQYREVVQRAEDTLLRFLRAFESAQEEIHLARVGDTQARLKEAVGDPFPALRDELSALSPPDSLAAFHTTLSQALTCCAEAYTTFLSDAGPQFPQSFLNSRQALSRGLYLLYEVRAQLPMLQPYWVLPTAQSTFAALETQAPDVEVPVGFSHKPRAGTRAEYSLYVPENYTPQETWPLIVCLHGGYGRGDEYIWTWLRPAKSSGYLLLSPKSLGPTWSVLDPSVDINSLQAMLAEVCATYAIDRKRIYLTGLSDGGIFTYIFGLSRPELFAGIAPIAGELHPMADPMLRKGQGKAVPLFIVHGAQDFIFDVAFTRQTYTLLQKLGYNVTYHELPDWGHAYSYTIHEQLVFPWFTSLGPKPEQDAGKSSTPSSSGSQ